MLKPHMMYRVNLAGRVLLVGSMAANCLIAIGCTEVVGDEGAVVAEKPSVRPNLARFHDGAFSAARMGELEALKEFVRRDSAVLHRTSGPDSTLLHAAADGNRPEVIEYLVAEGLDVNARDGLGLTPLHRAAGRGSLDAAKTLVELGADPKARKQFPNPESPPGQSVLSAAAQGGRPKVVKFLLDQGAPIVYGDADWKKPGSPRETALHWAALANTDWSDPQQAAARLATVDLLAKRIGDINTTATGAFKGGTVLHVAASQHQPPIVRYLLENYPEIDTSAKDTFGKTPLGLALAADPAGDPAAVRKAKKEAREVARLLESHRQMPPAATPPQQKP